MKAFRQDFNALVDAEFIKWAHWADRWLDWKSKQLLIWPAAHE